MLMMRAPAVRIMKSRSRAEAASSNLLARHRAVQKPAPTPHGSARFAAIHRLISSFRVRAGDPDHEHQRDPREITEEGRRRRWRASLKGFAFRASPSSGGPPPSTPTACISIFLLIFFSFCKLFGRLLLHAGFLFSCV